jgi:hypothetical protein
LAASDELDAFDFLSSFLRKVDLIESTRNDDIFMADKTICDAANGWG